MSAAIFQTPGAGLALAHKPSGVSAAKLLKAVKASASAPNAADEGPKYSLPPTDQVPVRDIARPGLKPKLPEIVVPEAAELIEIAAKTEKLVADERSADIAAAD